MEHDDAQNRGTIARSELIERADDLFWIGQDRHRVKLEAGALGMAGFELALEDEGSFLERNFYSSRRLPICGRDDRFVTLFGITLRNSIMMIFSLRASC